MRANGEGLIGICLLLLFCQLPKSADCDRQHDSTLKEDACGVCGGEGKDCKRVEGDYEIQKYKGYKDIITILKGATNIHIQEKRSTKNDIAIMMCHLPSEAGPCRGYEPKWYYEEKEARCREFIYRGCQGNSNRFETKEDCENTCSSQVVCSFSRDTGNCTPYHRGYYFNSAVGRCEHLTYAIMMCHLPSEAGPCRGYEPKWYYEEKEARCREFIYRGCQGNSNRFETKEDCENTCSSQVDCESEKDTGPCFEYVMKYFFNVFSSRCEWFWYGGCDGNNNRYDTERECDRKCRNFH